MEGLLAGLRLYASTDRSFGDYFKLARVSSSRLVRRNSIADTAYGTWLTNTAQVSAIRDNDRTRYTQQVSGTSGQCQGDVGWDSSNTSWAGAATCAALMSATVLRRHRCARVDQYDGANYTELQSGGALAAAIGGVYVQGYLLGRPASPTLPIVLAMPSAPSGWRQ